MDKELKLYMILLGCKPKGRFTEQHDVFFGIGNSLKDLIPSMNLFWPEAKGQLHIDAWREVTVVDNCSIQIIPKTTEPIKSLDNLYFINLGGYKENEDGAQEVAQFKVSDERSPLEVIKGLIEDGFIPSYCTSCYRSGRTGDRFMALAKSGQIQHVCQPNALMTLKEYALDFGDEALNRQVDTFIAGEIVKIQDDKTKTVVVKGLQDLSNGERDIFL